MHTVGQLGPTSLRWETIAHRYGRLLHDLADGSLPPEQPGQGRTRSSSTLVQGPYGERRLLIVEDDSELRNSLSELLRGDGYHVVGAANGLEALDLLRKGPAPDLILLDLMMPVKDGWQFRSEQKGDPSIAAIPVLALSADDSPKAVAIDAQAYVKKPFHYATLLGAIERVIEERVLAHRDRLASLGTLSAGIAHEINNPLTYLIANLELLEEQVPRLMDDVTTTLRQGAHEPGPEMVATFREVGAQLHDALEGAKRIRGIVSDVKMFSRTGDDLRAYVDVRAVLDSSLRVVMSEVRHRARLVKEYDPTPLVLASPGQLGQVFLNILLNAVQAIEGEHAEKNTIRVATRTTTMGEVQVEISDTGRGIEPEIQRRMFDPFFTTKPVGVGTGLGLSICHGIVGSLGGAIAVESQVGSGTTFRITLPASDERFPATPKATPSSVPSLRAKILIVDDDRQVAQAVKAMIGAVHDTQVVTASTDALAILLRDANDAPFDLVLCDLHMPEMSGMELHEKLAELRPAVAERMVFMTGGALNERSEAFVRSTSDRCIDKPIDMAQLRRIVAASLVHRQT